MRLIDANEAIKIINHAAEVCNSDFTRRILEFVAVRVETLKTIEAELVKHGRWVLKERAHYFKCSLCNEPIPYKFGYSESRRYYNYCPNCGAKMDLKGE